MPKDRPPSYKSAPEPPADPILRRRYDAIMSVLAQTQTVTAAAESLDMSRNHFQTILHRVLEAMIDAMTPKPAGRPAKPAREAALEAELEEVKAELAALQDHTAMMKRMMGALTSIVSGPTHSQRSRSRSKTTTSSVQKPSDKPSSEDPEPATTMRQAVAAMREADVPRKLCAKALGVSESTIGRRLHATVPNARPHRRQDERAYQRVREIVRATHGLVGAQSLGKRCGVPRRAAAVIKRHELREMELERKARCARVSVAAPGIIRGFDAMHLPCTEGKSYWLVAADAAIPYRTSIATVPVYDAAQVIATLIEDFERHGAPLVIRLDRIACQRTPEVHEMLDRYQVLPLHGPPRHPYYYGQLERQNREHRAWQLQLGPLTHVELCDAGDAMRTALNALWARPTLDWCTAEEAWLQRPTVDVDRTELRAEVHHRASGLVNSGLELLAAQRMATEAALIKRGLLTVTPGGLR
jgi:transposase InsO family protein